MGIVLFVLLVAVPLIICWCSSICAWIRSFVMPIPYIGWFAKWSLTLGSLNDMAIAVPLLAIFIVVGTLVMGPSRIVMVDVPVIVVTLPAFVAVPSWVKFETMCVCSAVP